MICSRSNGKTTLKAVYVNYSIVFRIKVSKKHRCMFGLIDGHVPVAPSMRRSDSPSVQLLITSVHAVEQLILSNYNVLLIHIIVLPNTRIHFDMMKVVPLIISPVLV